MTTAHHVQRLAATMSVDPQYLLMKMLHTSSKVIRTCPMKKSLPGPRLRTRTDEPEALCQGTCDVKCIVLNTSILGQLD